MAALLEQSGAYRVLRQLTPRVGAPPAAGAQTRLGLFVDVETTGLDTERDEIIELAMVPFAYGPDGEIYGVQEPFQALREPGRSIPPEVTAITGIDDAMVAGKAIDPAEVAAVVAPASLILAHNAAFDRRFLERFCESFVVKPWACSMCEVDWAGEGYEGTKLSYLAAGAGFFYERHRAAHDCLAAIELLARTHPRSGRTGMAQLLDKARRPQARIWAEHAPYDLKDILKRRGYRWNGDGQGGPRAWYIDVDLAAHDAEADFLRREIYQADVQPLVRRITAFERYSSRCGI
jgi:DNA polymerase III subunit epsilon